MMFRDTLKIVCNRYLKKITMSSFRHGESLIGILFVTPVVLYFLIFLLYPALGALYYSFTEWNMRTLVLYGSDYGIISTYYSTVSIILTSGILWELQRNTQELQCHFRLLRHWCSHY